MSRRLAFPALILGLVLICPSLAPAARPDPPVHLVHQPAVEHINPGPEAFPPPGRNFGVQENRLGNGLDLRLPPRAVDFLDRWFDLPDRLERAFWVGGFGVGVFACCVLSLIAFIFYRATRRD